MPIAPRITVAEAAADKGVSRNSIHKAINADKINVEWFGHNRAVVADKKFETWRPNPKRVAAQQTA